MKRYPLKDVQNARDLGGVPTLDGNVTNWGEFIRTATLDDAKDYDINYLKEMGVTRVIDLRREGEIAPHKESIAKIKENFDYYNVSLAGDREFRQEDIDKIVNKEISVGASYRNLIDNYKSVKEIMEIFADND